MQEVGCVILGDGLSKELVGMEKAGGFLLVRKAVGHCSFFFFSQHDMYIYSGRGLENDHVSATWAHGMESTRTRGSSTLSRNNAAESPSTDLWFVLIKLATRWQ